MESVKRTLGGSKVLLVGSVRGLVSEAAEVRSHFEQFAPKALAVPIGPRELDEIRETLKEKGELEGAVGNRAAGTQARHGPSGLPDEKVDKDENDSDYDDFGLFVSSSDLVFVRHLSRWGEVEMPPPSYQEAVRLGNAAGVPVVALDFDDDAYTEVFVGNVSALALVRQGRRLRKLAKRKFESKDPLAFAQDWDALFTKVKGYAAVERAREEQFAKGLVRAADKHERVLSIIEAERLPGVVAALDRRAEGRAAKKDGAP